MTKARHTKAQESEIKLSDFRLLLAHRLAVGEMKMITPPKTDKELKDKMKKVATGVAKKLLNAPAVALSAYIDPKIWQTWKRTVKKQESPTSTARSPKSLESLVAELFRAHWKAIDVDLRNGVDVAGKRADAFYARNRRRRLLMARRYYAPRRAASLANASFDEIQRLSEAWLDTFRNYVDQWWGFPLEGRELREEVRRLVDAEYVAFTGYGGQTPLVQPLPYGVLYEDVYEITAAGASSGKDLAICKSVAEPFSVSERDDTMAGLESEFFAKAAEAGEPEEAWMFDFLDSDDERFINVITGDREEFLD